jgi:molecular chaperone DnaK
MFFDRPIGIDLGTTNSEVAMLEPSEREIFVYEDRFKRRTVPSAVAWDAGREVFLVGRDARARRGKQPAPIESIKRKMGQTVKVACGPHELSPEEVSAKILDELRQRMQTYLGERAGSKIVPRVTRAVITVPAYFDAPQVEATRRAAELAKLDPIGILQEPTAAAVYQTFKRQLGDGNFLVYDLGGGTFDVSVLRCVGGEYQVVAIDGDNYLGGDDFDRRFAEHLRKQLVERGYALDLDVRESLPDRQRFDRLVHLAQEIKESLSTREVVSVSKQGVLEDKDGQSVDYDGEIGRAEYETIIGDLVDTTIQCSLRALEQSREKAAVAIGDIDRVILVGGSTRVPLVMRRVAEAICAKTKSSEALQDEVDTCVALGAAIHAAQIGGLRLGDEAQKARVSFTTPLVASKTPIKLGLKIEEAPAAAHDIAVLAGEAVVASAPMPGEAQARLAVPLAEEPEQAFKLAFRDRSQVTLASLDFALYRGDVRPRASALSRPAVVAKDISIEVVRAGRRERKVLLPRGTALPMKVKQTFYTADQSGAVVLRLLQGRMPIKTLMLQVPGETATGTAVELQIRCDEAMRMEARANVAGQELWASVEPPAPPKFDPAGDIEALLDEADAIGRSLWGANADHFRREANVLSASIREAAAIDPDKLSVLCHRLQAMLDEYRPDPTAGGLAPPLAQFDAELDTLRRVVYRAQSALMGMSREAWEERIRDIEERAHRAYDAVDAVAWRRVNNEVQALSETAWQEEFARMKREDGPAYYARRIDAARYRAGRIADKLADFVPTADDDVRALQLAERDRLLQALRDNVTSRVAELDPEDTSKGDETRRSIERIHQELDRLEAALDRIPSLGLVAEHGEGPVSR